MSGIFLENKFGCIAKATYIRILKTKIMNTNHTEEERIVLPDNVVELVAMGDAIWEEYLNPEKPLTKEEERLLQSKYREVAIAANAITPKSLVSELKLAKRKNKKEMHLSTEAAAANVNAATKGKKPKLSKSEKQAALNDGKKPKLKVDAKANAKVGKIAKTAAAPAKKTATKKTATSPAEKKTADTTERRAPLNEKEIAAIIKLIQKNTPYKQIKADFKLNSMTPIAHIKKNKMPA